MWSLLHPIVGRFVAPLAFGAGALLALAGAGLWDRFIDDPAVAREARAGYVAIAEKAGVEAELAEAKRQLLAVAGARDRFRLGLAEAQRAAAERTEQLESEIADYDRKLDEAGRACRLDRADIEWLRR